MKTLFAWGGLGLLLALGLLAQSVTNQSGATRAKPKLNISIKPQHVADALRAVITSDREVYAKLHAKTVSKQTGDSPCALPSPCEVLRLGSQAAASKGVEYSYVLRALAPLNPRNVPETEVEMKGLQFIATRPDLTYTAEELLGGRWYFTAVYPDTAIDQSCIRCHTSGAAAGRNVKIGDTIGGLVIRIALEL